MATTQDIMREHSIVADPDLVITACTKTGLPLNIMCAKLRRESYGGRNVFGNDRVAYPTEGPYTADTEDVTREAVDAYLAWRGPGPAAGSSGRQNGVGPSQLTWWSLQDAAEAKGGVHLPGPNMEVGAAEFKRLLDKNGGDLRAAAAEYNGGGNWRDSTAAVAYGDAMVSDAAQWQTWLNGAGSPPPATVPGADLPALAYGERSENVRRFQDWSNWFNWVPALPVVSETGYYGTDTRELVRRIQVKAGITGPGSDGTAVGPKTNGYLAGLGYPYKG